MTYPASAQAVAESEQAALAFQLAMAKIGALGAYEALSYWQSVNPVRATASMGTWLTNVMSMVKDRREQARSLAVSYFRLARALELGTTAVDPKVPDSSPVSLDSLREDFTRQLEEASVHVPNVQPTSPLAAATVDETSYKPPSTGGAEVIEVEVSLTAGDDIDREIAAYEAWLAEEERKTFELLEEELKLLGPENLEAKVVEIEDQDSRAEEKTKKAFAQAGAVQAARAERTVMDAARHEVAMRSQYDRRAMGYVRQAGRANPCGFCAMLISRGRIFYASAKTATTAGGPLESSLPATEATAVDGAYHDNCFCFAVPVFAVSEYHESDRYKINREMAVLWRTEIADKGLKGKDALNAFRRLMRDRERSAGRGETKTQEVTQ